MTQRNMFLACHFSSVVTLLHVTTTATRNVIKGNGSALGFWYISLALPPQLRRETLTVHRSGGKYPPLFTDTEGDNCFSIQLTSEQPAPIRNFVFCKWSKFPRRKAGSLFVVVVVIVIVIVVVVQCCCFVLFFVAVVVFCSEVARTIPGLSSQPARA